MATKTAENPPNVSVGRSGLGAFVAKNSSASFLMHQWPEPLFWASSSVPMATKPAQNPPNMSFLLQVFGESVARTGLPAEFRNYVPTATKTAENPANMSFGSNCGLGPFVAKKSGACLIA